VMVVGASPTPVSANSILVSASLIRVGASPRPVGDSIRTDNRETDRTGCIQIAPASIEVAPTTVAIRTYTYQNALL
jgi:hypothetical protein